MEREGGRERAGRHRANTSPLKHSSKPPDIPRSHPFRGPYCFRSHLLVQLCSSFVACHAPISRSIHSPDIRGPVIHPHLIPYTSPSLSTYYPLFFTAFRPSSNLLRPVNLPPPPFVLLFSFLFVLLHRFLSTYSTHPLATTSTSPPSALHLTRCALSNLPPCPLSPSFLLLFSSPPPLPLHSPSFNTPSSSLHLLLMLLHFPSL